MYFLDSNIPSDHGYIVSKRHYTEDYVSRGHWHGFIELEFVVSGNAVYKLGDSEFILSRGDVWLLSVYDSHQVVCRKGLTMLNIAIKPELLNEKLLSHLAAVHPLHCRYNEDDIAAFLSKVEELFREQTTQDSFSRLKAFLLLNEIVIDITRNAIADITPTDLGIMQNVFAWIQLHYQYDISLSQVADTFCLTPNYLGQLFKRTTGTSYNDYINSLRIQNACHLLQTSDKSIRDIAMESGYNSVEYFYCVFKKYCGVAPSKYRTLVSKKEPVSTDIRS